MPTFEDRHDPRDPLGELALHLLGGLVERAGI
jgi:hypothetical protein